MNYRYFILFILTMTVFANVVLAEGKIDIEIILFAENILSDFKNNNYGDLYGKMSTELKAVMPYEGMAKLFDLEKQILGDLEHYGRLDNMQQVVYGKVITTFRYTAYFENTGAIIILAIIDENGKPVCHKFNVDSLVFSKPEVQKLFETLSPR